MLRAQNGKTTWLSDQIGDAFTLVIYGDEEAVKVVRQKAEAITQNIFPLRIVAVADKASALSLGDAQGAFPAQYDARPGTTYLFRPDQPVLARWRTCDLSKVEFAMLTALCRTAEIQA
jgi:3-(3-hydroxy-phenyl)propionate hydroxylase